MSASRRVRTSGVQSSAMAVMLLAVAVALVAGACSSQAGSTTGPLATSSIAAPETGAPGSPIAVPASPVTGVLTAVDSSGLSAVSGFTLRLDDGQLLTFRIGTLENGAEFPPGHLAEHLATSAPVRVFFRADGPDLVVYRLEDAS